MLRNVAIGLILYLVLAGPLAVIIGKGLRRSREAFERDQATSQHAAGLSAGATTGEDGDRGFVAALEADDAAVAGHPAEEVGT